MNSLAVESKSREEAEVQLHFSFSQLNTYLICPQKYNFQYVIGLNWETKPVALPFGKETRAGTEKRAGAYRQGTDGLRV
jgi:hypothetical protein